MSLGPGARLGPYQIRGTLGVGGMAEVYLAHDTKLGREVAIKVLPQPFTNDPDHLARFEREAHALAALNHPHIGAIYGLEEGDGIRALVLELVSGDTLAERIARGPIPLDDALAIARQIAGALDAAHERGIVHRDLKPANIKITPDGVVKVLDFGLAKVAGTASAVDAGESTTVAGATREGVVLGTAAYMSPEQARGKWVDKRTDIWAFGCVLYEMLTGRAVFRGETFSDTVAAILQREPDWTALPPGTPENIRRLLGRSLQKEVQQRLRDIGDAALELEPASGAPEPARALPVRRWRLGALAAVCGVALLAAGAIWGRAHQPAVAPTNPLEGASFSRLTDFERAEQVTISRDGKFVAFLSDRDGAWDAWVGQVATGDFRNLTNGAVPELRNPAVRSLGFAPDGLVINIWSRQMDPAGGRLVDGGWAVPTIGGQLRRAPEAAAELDWSPDGERTVYHTSAAGDPMFVADPGNPVGRRIYAAQPGIHCHFPLWSRDGGFIYFVQGLAPDETDIWRIRSAGGEPERLTHHDSRVSFPTWLDSRTLLYLATAEDGSGPWIHALDVEQRTVRRVGAGIDEYLSLASAADGRRVVGTVSRTRVSLWRALLQGGAIEEAPTRVVLPTPGGFSPQARAGAITYRAPGAGTEGLWRIAADGAARLWSGADGRVVAGPALTADGRRIAFSVLKQGRTHLEVMNADGTNAHPIATHLDVRGEPSWSHDGRWIAVAVSRTGGPRLVKIPADGGPEVSLTDEYALDPVWSPSDTFLVFTGADVGTTFAVKAVTADGAPRPMPNLVLTRGARRLAFSGGDETLIVLKGDISHREFWRVDLATGRQRPLSRFGRQFAIGGFDITPDGRELIFDSTKDESEIVVIDLPTRKR